MSVQGVGHRWRPIQLTPRLPHIARDARDGGVHWGHHALGLLHPIHARLAEACVRRHRANPLDLRLDIPGHERAVSPHAALSIAKVVGVAASAHALDALRSLLTDAPVRLARGCRFLCDLCEVCRDLWGATCTAFVRLVSHAPQGPLPLRKHLLRRGGTLPSGPLCRGHGA
jgi:hypothetical protein